ncbi:MAG: A/G-specific adenine glycosylase [Acidimicrobiia bacterium]|nr:A/G-specific adenine glycosylase [Acidimicrobiia bacterium]
MLQQTQVARVIPRFEAFMARFGDPATCAAAPVAAVIDKWHGLGYNRRAVALHAAATACVDRHDGVVPAQLEALLALPGVGPYTARAVAAFAHECDVGVVDTNVGRILARLGGRSLRPAEAQTIADALVPPGEAWAWNQAMMDLGAGVCVRTQPRCDQCPVRACCAWQGQPADADPADGSAGVGRGQSRFAGSDRQGRGRLVDGLRRQPMVTAADLAEVAGWPDDPERARRVAATLVADGLARWDDDGGLRRAG